MRWVGGANIPLRVGRLGASWPLAVFETERDRLRFTIRGGTRPVVDCGPQDVVIGFPATSFWRTGVGLRMHDGRDLYFLTNSWSEIILALGSAGFATTQKSERALQWRRSRQS